VLRVRGEREFVVQPLALPDPTPLPEKKKLVHAATVALFLERAREVLPDFELTDEDLPLIAAICRRLSRFDNVKPGSKPTHVTFKRL
jgi:predicted ATPase